MIQLMVTEYIFSVLEIVFIYLYMINMVTICTLLLSNLYPLNLYKHFSLICQISCLCDKMLYLQKPLTSCTVHFCSTRLISYRVTIMYYCNLIIPFYD